MSRPTEVSVVLPAYNEATTIEETISATLDALGSFLPRGSFEVIVAEDGCDDRTPELVDQYAAVDDRVLHVHSDDRLGRGGALERAFRSSSGDTLVYFDTDRATDMAHLEELVESVRTGGYDVATGSRWAPGNEADRSAKRGIASRGYNGLVRLFLPSDLEDHQCGFKAFDREALFALLDDVEGDHWFWDTEVLVRAQRSGMRVKEFPIRWEEKGDSKVDLVRDVFGMGSQILQLWWGLSVAPRLTTRVTVAAGVLLSVVAIALMTLYIDPSAVLDELGRTDPTLVAAAAGVYIASWPVRGARYRDILDELGFRERVSFLTGAVFVSQTGNLVFPARMGDAIRAYVVKARRGIPYPSGFASLVVERVFDLLSLSLIAGIVLVSLSVTGSAGDLVSAITGAERAGRLAVGVASAVGLAAVVVVAGIVASARSDRNVVQSAADRVGGEYVSGLADVVERFVADMQRGAGSTESFVRVGGSSLLIWVLDVVTAVLVLAAFGVAADVATLLAVGFFAVSVGNLAKVLPLSPGGIGLYEAAFTLIVVALTPIAAPVAFGAALLDHAVKNAVTVVGGAVSMVVLNVSLTTAVDESADPDADVSQSQSAVTGQD
jgi:hypothetical protein